jgi:hypothetical protein
VVANPTVQFYSFAAGAFIAQNDDWQTTNPQCDAPAVSCGGVTEIIATGLDPCLPNPGQSVAPPGCAQESAILITLPPGNYGAIVSGVGDTTGVGLVEVFDVTFLLGVTKAGPGSGTITSSPPAITCGADCSEIYTGVTGVTLTATPDPGSSFGGWSGDLDCPDGVVTTNADKICTATFTQP